MTRENVYVKPSRAEMGELAAEHVAADLKQRLAQQDTVRVVFAAAPSQQEMLDALVATEGIDWNRVEAFHMDEYIGLDPSSPARFGNWLKAHIFDRVPFKSVHLITTEGDAEASAQAYAEALGEAPIDVVYCGMGVNGHLAFNDPPVADFSDPLDVKVVELDDICRQQQVDDGCFPTFDDVPTHAVTLTIPCLLRSKRLFCVVPSAMKADAVRAAFHEPVSTDWPCTALREHPACSFYFDEAAASKL